MISPKFIKLLNSIKIHKISKFHQISIKSEKHRGGADDFTKVHKVTNVGSVVLFSDGTVSYCRGWSNSHGAVVLFSQGTVS